MITTENAVLLGYNLKMIFSGGNSPLVEGDKYLLRGGGEGIYFLVDAMSKFLADGDTGKTLCIQVY